ncbi:MAG: amidase family protein [Rhodospirillales bacterium]|nr:amidase family protein [Rhodospirillales bacterium]
MLKKGEISPKELIYASSEQIKAVDGPLNALPTLCAERALETASKIDRTNQDNPGWLGGLPIAVKDLNNVGGVRTTYGSPIFADNVPKTSDVMVKTLEANGALVVAKSNTPEFGAGANTFNEVFGATRNPWNLGKTCGGSSGGSAVALATGQVWLATGSDLGGSLRIPASFCSIVGLRPSPGRVARHPTPLPYGNLNVEGPMGRNVGDVALMLDAMVGGHPKDPISVAAPLTSFQQAVDQPAKPRRVAFTKDLGGLLPVDPEVAEICEKAALKLTSLGIDVEEESPDFSEALECFQTLRAAQMATNHFGLYQSMKEKLKPDLVWNIEKGLALTANEIGIAELSRGQLYQRMANFFDDYDLLLCPTAIVPPFDVDQRFVEEVNGHKFDNYVDWLGITFAITLTSCPTLSLPCGFTASGLPVGLQIIGKPRGEADLLSGAAMAENLFGLAEKVPFAP